MGFFSKIWKGVKNVFNKVTKAVKNVVKSVGKTAKKVWDKVKDVGVKVWDGVKSVTKKVSKTMSKLGPLANIAMNFIPGFGQMWAAYGIWGQVAKGAITGFVASGGNVKGMLVGAAVGGLSYGYTKLPGTTLSEKISSLSDRITSDVVKKGAKTYSKLVKNYSGGIDAFNKDAVLNAGGGMNNLVDVGNKYLGSGLEGVKDYKHAGWSGLEGVEDYRYAAGGPGLSSGLDGNWSDYTAGGPGLGSGLEGVEDYRYAAGGPGLGSGLEDLNTPRPSLLDKAENWADKLRSAIPSPAWGNTASAQQGYPYSVGDTGPLNSANADAAVGRGQVGMGTDIHDIKKMTGLLAAVDRIRESEGVFLNSQYS